MHTLNMIYNCLFYYRIISCYTFKAINKYPLNLLENMLTNYIY